MLKSTLRACIGALLAVFAISAHAAMPEVVKNSTGTVAYGTHTANAIQKDTSSGNRTMVLYSSGWQYVADDASWTRYAALKAAIGARALVVANDPNGLVIAVANSNGIYCQSGGTQIAFPVGQAIQLSDGCAYHQSVMQNSN